MQKNGKPPKEVVGGKTTNHGSSSSIHQTRPTPKTGK